MPIVVSSDTGYMFGWSVAVSGSTALIGAPLAGGTFISGAAFLHALEEVFADVTCDGHVNGFDLALVLAAWGPVSTKSNGPSAADLDHDGVVNYVDLALLLGAWTS